MTHHREARTRTIVHKFTAAAAATGAVPVPAASLAIVGENAAMIAAIADAMGQPVTAEAVFASLGTMATVHRFGRAVFVEGARLLGWAAGPLGLWGVAALGASTAGLQTWVIGHVAIAVAQHGGRILSRAEADRVAAEAHHTFH